MKKTVLIFMAGFLLIAGNLYAGDLTVSGNLGVGTDTPAAKLDILSNDFGGLNVDVTKTGTGWLTGAKFTFTDSSSAQNLSGMRVTYTHTGSVITNHVASSTTMNLQGSGSSGMDVGKIGHAYSLYFKGPAGSGYNYTNANAYAFGLRAMVGTLGTRTHYIRNIGGLQILHQYDNSSRTLSAENLYGIIVGDISQYSSGGLNYVNNAGGIQVNKQTDSAGGRIGNLQGIWLNGDGTGADLVLGANKETKLYGSSGNLIIDTAGKMGIGTTNPTAKLQVAGGDVYTSTAGNGLIVKSPNGAICKRIGIDNSGNIVATAVTCP